MPERAEIEAVLGLAVCATCKQADNVYCSSPFHQLADRVRDARGDNERWPECGCLRVLPADHPWYGAETRRMNTCEIHGSRSPQGEDYEAATDALLGDSGLPRYGAHRNTVERRVRIALEAADRVRSEMQDHEEGIKVCTRGPRDDDAEKMDALGSYLEKYPPAGFADRYSADGWRHIARGVLSAAVIFFAARSPQGEDHGPEPDALGGLPPSQPKEDKR